MKNQLNILSLLLLLSCSSCGMFTKVSKHTSHEVNAATIANASESVISDVTVKGDSIITIPSTSIQVYVPCIDSVDSVITESQKIYIKPVFRLDANNVKILQGFHLSASTVAKTIRPGLTITERKASTKQAEIKQSISSTETAATIDKKHDNRLGGYTTIIIIISLLCVGLYVAKRLKLF